MIVTRIVVNLEPLKVWGKSVQAQVLPKVFKQWAVRYRGFSQLRFDRASKGDGTWRPLSVRTIAGRRQNSSTILRDTGTLFAALTPVWAAPPGSINELLENGVRVGFGGSSAHPSGLVTIAQIANFHQEGGGRLPKREILVEPPPSLIEACTNDLNREILKSTQTS